jgi:glycosyltransferase involved in cell wall biosynthesis
MPNVALEFSATGIPVIATRVGGIPEVIIHEKTGWLFDPGDSRALGTLLCQAVRDLSALRRLGLAGRKHIEGQFDAAQFAPSMIDMYRRAISHFQSRYHSAPCPATASHHND